ncbi:MAG: hypothetical protein CME25_17020 [Gemmatimonadetes bacterium]|nr:hypothetical protein [Gemmatimonadota bacterium]
MNPVPAKPLEDVVVSRLKELNDNQDLVSAIVEPDRTPFRLTSVKPVFFFPTLGCKAVGKRDESVREQSHPIWVRLFGNACLNERRGMTLLL